MERITTLRRCVTPERYRSGHDPLGVLQAATPKVLVIDASAVLAGPAFDHPLGIVPKKVSLGYDPPYDPTDTVLGLLVERPMAHVPIEGQEVGSLVGEPPPLIAKIRSTIPSPLAVGLISPTIADEWNRWFQVLFVRVEEWLSVDLVDLAKRQVTLKTAREPARDERAVAILHPQSGGLGFPVLLSIELPQPLEILQNSTHGLF